MGDIQFEPIEFVNNLPYMGFGMLGIFVVIGVIAGTTVLLNRLFSSKKSKEN